MPDEAEKRRRAAADGRRFDIDTRDTSLTGTASVWGELDVADALDLDAAVTAGAEQLKALGSTDSLDVRRAAAVGELARHQQTLDLNLDPADDDDAGREPARGGRRGRWCSTPTSPTPRSPTPGSVSWAGWRTPRSLITAEQVRAWCANPDTQVIVKPVIDLNDHVHVDAVRGARPDGRGRRPGRRHVCVPLLHPPRPRLPTRRARRRLRPHHARTAPAGRPAPAISRRCAGATTG